MSDENTVLTGPDLCRGAPLSALSDSRGGRALAVAVVQRDLEGLRSEVEFERALAAIA